MRPLISSLALFAWSSVFMIGVFEIACRTIVDTGMHYHLEMWKYAVSLKETADDPAIGHRHKPSSSARLMGADVIINAMGLRDDEVDSEAQGAAKVLMLGDSITLGWGVPQDETVSARLEPLLTESLGHDVTVINSGVGNYNTSMEVAWFEQNGLGLRPDAVVLNVFINDAEPTPEPAVVRWWDTVLYSRVILFGAFDTIERLVFGGPDWKDYYRDLYATDASGWSAMQAAVKRLEELCEANDIPLVIVDYPELRELDPYPFKDISRKIAALAYENQIEYVSLLPSVQHQKPSALWVTAPDPHPNSFANKLFAEFLVPHLAKVLGAID